MTPVYLRGETAPTQGDAPEPSGPSGPLLLIDAGRVDPQPTTWARPVSERLWQRIAPERRAQHERLLKRHAAAEREARNVAAKLAQQRVADDEALQAAIEADRQAPARKSPKLEQELERAQEREREIGEMVVRSGKRLLEDSDDSVVQAAIDEAAGEVRALIEALPGKAREIREDLAAAGRVGHEAAWLETLLRKRRTGPFRGGGNAPPSPRLGAAGEAATRLEAEVAEELRERDRRRHPVEHHAPRAPVPVDLWPEPDRTA